MSYRKNPSDKEQSDVERAVDDSAIRIAWFNRLGVGITKSFKAYDLYQQRNATIVAPAMDNMKQFGHIVATHNDRPSRFDNPGKA